MQTTELIEAVDRHITELFLKFYENPTIFMSEGDVQCYLYSLLANDRLFGDSWLEYPTATKEDSRTFLVHSDVGVTLEGKPKNCDILIFDPNSTKDLDPLIGIEIKYNRRVPARNEKSNIIEDIKKVSAAECGYILWLNWDRRIEDDHLEQVKKRINGHKNVELFYLDVFSDPIKTNVKEILDKAH